MSVDKDVTALTLSVELILQILNMARIRVTVTRFENAA